MPATQPPRDGGATRARLIAAADELLGSGGVEAVTLRAVGTRAGVSRSAPYRHFADKDALLLAVARQGFHGLREAMAPGADLEAACVAYVRVALAYPRHYRLMFGGLAGRAGTADLSAAASEITEFFLDTIAAAQAAGQVRPGDPREVAALLWSVLHGLVDLTLGGHLHPGEPGDGAEAMPRLIGQVLAGLAPAPRNGRPAAR